MVYALIFVATLVFFTGLWKLLNAISNKIDTVGKQHDANSALETPHQQTNLKEQSK